MILRKHDIETTDDSHKLYTSPPPEVADHPLFGKGTVGIMTAEAPRFQSEPGGNEALSNELKTIGLRHEDTHGSYGGPEHSLIIHGPTREQMFHLGHKFGQEAVVYSQDGKHEMLYTNGPHSGKAHPALPQINFSQSQPKDFYTHIPGRGYVTLHFGDDMHETPVKGTMPLELQMQKPALSKREIALQLAQILRKSLDVPQRWAGSYDWHDGHTSHHASLIKDEAPAAVSPPKPVVSATPTASTNTQSAKAGVKTYAQFAQSYGTIDKSKPSNLKFYPMEGTGDKVNDLVKKHGYHVYYAGGKNGMPDLATKNYDTKHLMIWDPSAGSGSDFGATDYTDNWRKTHELAHALTHQQLNQKYGEGRRMGGLGKMRTPNEAKRAVEWEWLAAHKQRDLAGSMGVHISDEDFHRELNTVMHDAVHRAVTGRFTEPSEEGFQPHSHKIPLEHALNTVDEHAHAMGLQSDHETLQKFSQDLAVVLKSALKR